MAAEVDAVVAVVVVAAGAGAQAARSFSGISASARAVLASRLVRTGASGPSPRGAFSLRAVGPRIEPVWPLARALRMLVAEEYSNLIKVLISRFGNASQTNTPIMTKCTLHGHLRAVMEQDCSCAVRNTRF